MTPYLQQRTLFPPQILAKPSLNLGLIVVIPAHDEAYLLLSLMSLLKCERPNCDVEVIIVINGSDKDDEAVKERNFELTEQVQEWAKQNRRSWIRFFVLHHPDLNPKHAGVGLARKIGMDEASWRFQRMGNEAGIIVCFDADSRCQPNYFQQIEQHFQKHPKTPACSIHFEHPLCGPDYEEAVYEAIILYELHLRYYINAQRLANFPMAFQTIGSSMAVKSDAYQRQGGMNRRKAGEDFYFIHKFTGSGHFSELKTTTVIPSPRPSTRVPFGTGRAIIGLLKGKMQYESYAPESFLDLKAFLAQVPHLYDGTTDLLRRLPRSVQQFLQSVNFEEKWKEINQHTSNLQSFQKRFYQWFDAFMLMKFLHFLRDHYYANVEVKSAAIWLLEELGQTVDLSTSAKDLLLRYRALDLDQSN